MCKIQICLRNFPCSSELTIEALFWTITITQVSLSPELVVCTLHLLLQWVVVCCLTTALGHCCRCYCVGVLLLVAHYRTPVVFSTSPALHCSIRRSRVPQQPHHWLLYYNSSQDVTRVTLMTVESVSPLGKVMSFHQTQLVAAVKVKTVFLNDQ